MKMRDPESSITIFGIVNHLPDRGLQIAAISVETHIIGEALGVASEAELVVGLVPVSE